MSRNDIGTESSSSGAGAVNHQNGSASSNSLTTAAPAAASPSAADQFSSTPALKPNDGTSGSVTPRSLSSHPTYFERQEWARCAMHALNNLLQYRAFDRSSLNRVCEELSPGRIINPHKSIFGIGNWDVNVLMRALSEKGLTVEWFDRRKPVCDVPFSSIFGLILNTPVNSWTSLTGRHWTSIRRFEDGWFLFDSHQEKPIQIQQIESYLAEILPPTNNRGQLLLVRVSDSPISSSHASSAT